MALELRALRRRCRHRGAGTHRRSPHRQERAFADRCLATRRVAVHGGRRRLPTAVRPAARGVRCGRDCTATGSDELPPAPSRWAPSSSCSAGAGDRAAARGFPRALIRGIQLTVGLLCLKIAWGLVAHPPPSFAEHALDPAWAVPVGAVVVLAAVAFRRRTVTLVLVGIGIAVIVATAHGPVALGPSSLQLPDLEAATFWTALTVLVLPHSRRRSPTRASQRRTRQRRTSAHSPRV